MNKSILVVWAMLAALVHIPALAGDVTVKWQDPTKYTDINPGEQDQARFEANLFKGFNDIFADLAQKLPDNVHWAVTVTDLDLAGEVRPSARAGGRDTRIVRATDRPAITFDYTMTDGSGKQIAQAKVDLKDLNFIARSPKMIGLTVKPFPYEEFMINQWFVQQQSQKIIPAR